MNVFLPGDVMLGDRMMCAWTEMVMLQQRGVDSVCRFKKNRKADFSAYESEAGDAPLTFVAELKVYGEEGFFRKVLTGGNLGEVRRRALRGDGSVTFKNCDADRQLILGAGLLADYFRLVDYVDPAPLTRMLVLCVRKADVPDELGRLLQKVEFERPGVMLHDSEAFWAKSWVVGASA